MGARGPVPEPDNVRFLKGNPQKRPPKTRLKLPPKAPAPPSWMAAEAKAEWNRIVPALDRMGVLATVDRALLATYCSAWARFVQAEAVLKKDGLFSDAKTREAKHPLWQVWREAATQIRELAKELYLTPTARLRSEIPEGDAGGPSSGEEDDILD